MGRRVPAGESLAFTVTAPIRLPAKTSAALQAWLLEVTARGEARTIHGNAIHARRVKKVPRGRPRVIGFVHNPDSDADLLLDLAAASLRERSP